MSLRPTSIEGLWEAIQGMWVEIPQETIDHVIGSMDERRKVVLEVDGSATRW